MSSFRAILFFLLLFVFAVPAFSVDYDYEINLKQRKFVPAHLQKTGLQQQSSSLMNKHIIMQFYRPLTEQDKQNLAIDGIELLSYVPNFAYVVKLDRNIDESFASRHNIRWMGDLYPDDKISPRITISGIGDWARRGSDRVEFFVRLHKDEDIEYWAKQFESKYGAEILGFARWTNGIELIVPELTYLQLTEEDAVIYIEQDDPPQEVNNNQARANNGSEILQAVPYNLSGAGIVVAEWDGGQPLSTHPDLLGRVTAMDGASVSDHASHVAGTVLGDGSLQGGTYRGMAPAATLLSHLWWGGSSEIESEYTTAVLINGALVSTNSWGLGVGTPSESACQSGLGYYASANATLDEAVRGNGVRDPITICWSAGNQRGGSSQYCGSIGWTWHTIGVYGGGKNLITCGAHESVGSAMTSFSSWGPTDDGRLKPDVTGPGCTLRSCSGSGGYWNACGTSMSTPATAGLVALMNEAVLASPEVGHTVLPSTIKGVLINTAIDLGLGGVPNGPDFAFGHGKVDGVAAVEKIVIGEPSYVENSITTGTSHLYDLTVPSGSSKLKVTLVWDDPGGTGIGGKDLINDLDLELIDPFSSIELPWVLDPPNPSDPATKGVDRLNNVETVEIDSPTPGLWKARVSGFDVPDGPQNYSIVFTPDSINTPGNLAALAVFDESDHVIDPGDSTVVQFWVTNVGANTDSVSVSINDDMGWLRSTLDSEIVLNVWDSAYFTVIADVPGGSVAGLTSVVECVAVSKTDSFVTSAGDVEVSADAYYDVELAPFSDDTVLSPSQFTIDALMENLGNDYDHVIVTVADDLGWTIAPISFGPTIFPFGYDTVTFTVTVPAEVPHLTVNNLSVRVAGTDGNGDTANFQVTVDNQFLPPQLVSPSTPHYTQDRTGSFTWSGEGDSYNLVISTNVGLTNIIRSYSGIADQFFTMPDEDSLNDGVYYWAVKQYVGPDSSSYQGSPRVYAVDNIAPQTMMPLSPINGQYVGQKIFSFIFSTGKIGGTEAAAGPSPEFRVLEAARDSAFSNDLHHYEPISGGSLVVPDTLDEGRWFWRVEQADSAGNHSGFGSSIATFVLDSETPAIPTLINPADSSNQDQDTVVFRWSSPPPPVWEHAGEYYRIQVSTSPIFLSLITNQLVYADSLEFPSFMLPQNESIYWRVKASDSASHSSDYQSSPFQFTYSLFICGDVNSDEMGPNILDLNFLVNYVFRSGPAPNPFIAGSVDCDSDVNLLDLNYMVNYIFRSGPEPCCQ